MAIDVASVNEGNVDTYRTVVSSLKDGSPTKPLLMARIAELDAAKGGGNTPVPAAAPKPSETIVEPPKPTYDDEMEFEVAPGSKFKLKDLVSTAKSYAELKEEHEAAQEELKGLRLKKSTEMEEDIKFLQLKGKSKQEIVDALFEAEGGFNGIRESLRKEIEQLAGMSPSERKEYEDNKARMEAEEKTRKLQADYEEKINSMKKQEKELENKQILGAMRSAFDRNTLPNPEKSEYINDLNELIFNKAKAALINLEKNSGVKLTEAIIQREFKKAFASKKADMDKYMGKATSKSVEEQIDKTTAAMQKLNNSTGSPVTKEQVFAAWFKKIEEGKSHEIIQECKGDPKKMQMYSEFGDAIRARRHLGKF